MTPTAQRFQKRLLRVLLAAAIVCLAWGLLRLRLDHVTHAEAMAELSRLKSPPALAAAALRAEPVALLCAGIALLVISPFARLLLLLGDFVVQRDRLYAATCAGVAVIILISFAMRFR